MSLIDIIYLELWQSLCLVEQNHLCNFFFLLSILGSVGAKSQILSSVAPPGRKAWSLFSVMDMSWGLGNPCFTKFSVVNFL